MANVKLENAIEVDSYNGTGGTIKVPTKQSVEIETEEDGTEFATVTHDSEDLNLTFENLKKLHALIGEAIEKFKA